MLILLLSVSKYSAKHEYLSRNYAIVVASIFNYFALKNGNKLVSIFNQLCSHFTPNKESIASKSFLFSLQTLDQLSTLSNFILLCPPSFFYLT